MTTYELSKRRRWTRVEDIAELDAELDALRELSQVKLDDRVRKDCAVKIAILSKIKDELLTPAFL